MMATKTIEYKVICEVNVLHDYYLIDRAYRSYFSLNDSDLKQLLDGKLRRGLYDLRRDLEWLINREAAQILKNFRMRLLPNPLGFKLAIEVKSENQINGSRRFRPVISIPEDAELNIGIQITNPLFVNFTNIALRPSDNKIYSFTNNGPHDGRSLSRPVSTFDTRQSYRMGDLVLLDGQVTQAIEDHNGDTSKWEAVSGNGFVNEADRILDTQSGRFRDWRFGFPLPMSVPFGLIDLRFRMDNQDYTLITPDGYLITQQVTGVQRAVPPRFELRFLSRATYWRYQKQSGFVPAEIDQINERTNGGVETVGGAIVTRKPRYFAQALTVFGANSGPLSNPEPTTIKAEGRKLYSDILFNSIHPVSK